MGSCKRIRSGISGEDRINNLPEGILTQILSYLTTKEAMRTSVLSKYWKFQWTYTCNIVIDDTEFFCTKKNSTDFFKDESARNTFKDFVERTLLITAKNFHLKLEQNNHDLRPITTWISTYLLGSKVESIDIYCVNVESTLPGDLFNCPSLVRNIDLKLLNVKAPPSSLFSNLVTLNLHAVDMRNENPNTNTLQYTFPILETFSQTFCKWLNVKSLELSVPSLTKFVYRTCEASNFPIKLIGARRLKEFKASCALLNIILIESHVTCAVLRQNCCFGDFQQKSQLQLRKLLRGLSSVEKLEISSRSMKAILKSKQELSLLEFYKLEKLYLRGCMPDIGALFELLHSMPMLKLVDIDSELDESGDGYEYDYDAMECVPPCFLNSLEDVWFNRFSCKTPQMHLAKFVLKNGKKMKRAWFSVDPMVEIGKVKEELSTYPRGSTLLKLHVY